MRPFFCTGLTFSAILVLCAWSIDLSAQLENGLLVHYPLAGDVSDISGNDFHGTPSGVVYGPDAQGTPSGALISNGFSTYVDMPDAQELKPEFPITVSIVAKFDDISGQQLLFTTDFNTTTHSGIWLQLSSNGLFTASFGNAAGGFITSTRRAKQANFEVLPNVWHVYTAVFQGPNDIDIYIDCEWVDGPYGGTAGQLGYTDGPGSLCRKHANPPGAGFPPMQLTGSIHDFRLWNRALDEDEILELCELTCQDEFEIVAGDYCAGETFVPGIVSLSGNTAEQVLWQVNGENYEGEDPEIMIEESGDYTLTVTVVSDGCTYESETSVSVSDLLGSTEVLLMCEGGNAILPDGSEVAMPGTYEVLLSNGDFLCDSLITVVVEEIPIPPMPDLPTSVYLCPGDTVQLDLSGYQEWDEVTDSDGAPLQEISFDAPGIYSLVFVSDCGNIDADIEVTGPVFTDPLFSATPEACINGDVEVEIPDWEPGNADLVLDQGNGSETIPQESVFILTYPEAGTYLMQLTGLLHGCEVDFEVSVDIEEPLELELPAGESICTGEVAALDLSSFNFPVFLDGNALGIFQTSSAGTYTFTASNACGTVSADYVVDLTTFFPKPFQDAQVICEERDTVSLGFLNPTVNVEWQSGHEGPVINATEAGVYTAQVSDSSGACGREFQFDLEAFPYDRREVFPDEGIALCAEGVRAIQPVFIGVPYTFPDGSTGYSYEVEESGTIEVFYSDGCHEYAHSVDVEVRECLCPLWVPNAFTPDGDGKNDIFKPVADCPVYDYRLRIFNRWGEQVFESRDIDEGWNGSSPNSDYFADNALYIYLIDYVQDLEGLDVPTELKGHLNLLR